jgi:hypothetical protein
VSTRSEQTERAQKDEVDDEHYVRSLTAVQRAPSRPQLDKESLEPPLRGKVPVLMIAKADQWFELPIEIRGELLQLLRARYLEERRRRRMWPGLPPFSWTVGGLRPQVSFGCC